MLWFYWTLGTILLFVLVLAIAFFRCLSVESQQSWESDEKVPKYRQFVVVPVLGIVGFSGVLIAPAMYRAYDASRNLTTVTQERNKLQDRLESIPQDLQQCVRQRDEMQAQVRSRDKDIAQHKEDKAELSGKLTAAEKRVEEISEEQRKNLDMMEEQVAKLTIANKSLADQLVDQKRVADAEMAELKEQLAQAIKARVSYGGQHMVYGSYAPHDDQYTLVFFQTTRVDGTNDFKAQLSAGNWKAYEAGSSELIYLGSFTVPREESLSFPLSGVRDFKASDRSIMFKSNVADALRSQASLVPDPDN